MPEEIEMVDFSMPKELVEALDSLIKEYGGTYSDWVQLSVVRGFWEKGFYSDAFRIFCKVEFDTSDVLREAHKMFIEELEKLEEKP